MIGILTFLCFSVFFYKSKYILLVSVLLFLFYLLSLLKSSLTLLNTVYMKYFFYLDSCSYLLILMSTLVVLIVLYYNLKISTQLNKILLLSSFLLLISVIFCFMGDGFLFFFVFFELSIIPMFFIVVFYGVQPERLLSLNYMMIYTLVGVIPFFLGLFFQYNSLLSLNYFVIWMEKMEEIFHLVWFGFWGWWMCLFMMAMVIKLPLYGLHLWLPKVHVEAPVEGSVLLAGILLKLGSYGIYRMGFGYWWDFEPWWEWAICLFVINLIICSLLCYSFKDFKVFVAYSSVVHMLMLMIGGMSNCNFSIIGMVLLSVSHGYCSAGMFFIVNAFYLCSKSRNMKLKNSFNLFFGLLGLFWFLICFMKCSLPPCLKIVSELVCFYKMMNFLWISIFFMILSVFLSGLFCFVLYGLMVWGSMKLTLLKSGFMNNKVLMLGFLFILYSVMYLFYFSILL